MDNDGIQNFYPERDGAGQGPGSPAAAVLAMEIYQEASESADWKLVADRMYRALIGAKVSAFVPRRKGFQGQGGKR